jgi:hypothetical protein
MTVVNKKEQGVQQLVGYCLPPPSLDLSNVPDDVEVPSFQRRAKCSKCGRRGRWVDVRPNWKERPGMPDRQGRPAWEK